MRCGAVQDAAAAYTELATPVGTLNDNSTLADFICVGTAQCGAVLTVQTLGASIRLQSAIKVLS